jgi:chromosome segregation ATPase
MNRRMDGGVMNRLRRALPWCGGAVLSAYLATVVVAQGKSEAADGSLAALTAELRQLRQAVEQLTRSQTQTQALGVYLSAQQSRIVQVAARLDSAQKDLDSASLRAQQVQSQLAVFSTELQRVVEPQKRDALEDALRATRAEQRSVELALQQARSRESELSQALQVEESRWNDLISRLQQVVTK